MDHLGNIDSEFIKVFLVFRSQDDSKKYIEKQAKSKTLKILHKYSTLPIILIKTKPESLEKISSDKLIQTIDFNSRCYLSNLTVDDSINKENLSFDESYNSTFKKPVRVAIVDSGIDQNHSDLKNIPYSKIEIVEESWNDIVGHGTLISGMVAESIPTLELIDVKVVGRSGLFYTSDVLLGLDLLYSKPVDIVLFGFSNPTRTDGKDVLTQMCDKFGEKSVFVVAPAGNFGPDYDTIGFTSNLTNGFCIGSLQSNGKQSFFSSRDKIGGEKPDFYVLGENITSTAAFHGIIGRTHPNYNSYRILSGTSVSAALFTSLLANILSAFPEYTYSEILEFLTSFNPTTHELVVEEVQKKIHELRPPPVSFKKIVTIASLVTVVLGILGISIIFLI